MSATSTPADSPVSAPIQPMHNPSQAAYIIVPQAPLGNTANGASNPIPGMGMKALLAKKMAKNSNPKFVSPTDNFMTPVTQKLNAAKQKHFTKDTKPMGALFATKESHSSENDDHSQSNTEPSDDKSPEVLMEEDENPF